MSLLANSNAIESGGYNIDRSLRFRSSASAYLSRNMGSSLTLKTFTFNFWIKLGYVGTGNQGIFYFDQANSNADGLDLSANALRFFAAGGASAYLVTTQVFRDPSSWGMFTVSVDTTQATASNRVKLYWNGSQITAFSTATYPSLNYNFTFNTANLGRESTPTNWYFDGYLAEVNFIDGQALTPSSFGQTDAVTGVWQPIKYTGTYGTNGFYLPFSDNTSATTLAYDKSGNGNNWTPNNISTTAGATYDSMTDVPTLTSATAANYCVLNPLRKRGANTIVDANLKVTLEGGANNTTVGTQTLPFGSFYWEATLVTGGNSDVGIGIITSDTSEAFMSIFASGGVGYYGTNGNKYINGAATSYGATFTVGDVIGVACDGTNITFYKNNTSQGSFSLPAGTFWTPAFSNATASNGQIIAVNFGQRPFSYTPPTGFKALNTFNLPDPTIKKPNQYMDATLYTGTGSAQSATNAGSFQPDFVWIKGRNAAGCNNTLTDSVRGVNHGLWTDQTAAEDTYNNFGTLTAFNSNGFSVAAGGTGGTNVNTNGTNYVGWQWKKGATPGFDIVTYTGTGVARTVSHSLGVAPSMMIVKDRTTAGTSWQTYHKSLGATDAVMLNTTGATFASSAYWNNTAPTSSVFTVGTSSFANTNAENYVAYLFAEIPGFSKFGSYTGNGSADGPFVYCGFRPKYVLIKSSSVATTDWYVQDATVNPSNVVTKYLYPNLSSAEQTNGIIDFTSNGFKLRNTYAPENQNGATYIYAAFAENPFKYANAR